MPHSCFVGAGQTSVLGDSLQASAIVQRTVLNEIGPRDKVGRGRRQPSGAEDVKRQHMSIPSMLASQTMLQSPFEQRSQASQRDCRRTARSPRLEHLQRRAQTISRGQQGGLRKRSSRATRRVDQRPVSPTHQMAAPHSMNRGNPPTTRFTPAMHYSSFQQHGAVPNAGSNGHDLSVKRSSARVGRAPPLANRVVREKQQSVLIASSHSKHGFLATAASHGNNGLTGTRPTLAPRVASPGVAASRRSESQRVTSAQRQPPHRDRPELPHQTPRSRQGGRRRRGRGRRQRTAELLKGIAADSEDQTVVGEKSRMSTATGNADDTNCRAGRRNNMTKRGRQHVQAC